MITHIIIENTLSAYLKEVCLIEAVCWHDSEQGKFGRNIFKNELIINKEEVIYESVSLSC